MCRILSQFRDLLCEQVYFPQFSMMRSEKCGGDSLNKIGILMRDRSTDLRGNSIFHKSQEVRDISLGNHEMIIKFIYQIVK